MTTMTKLVIPFHVADMGEEEVQSVVDVIRSGWLTMGPKTVEFEKNFARYVGSREAVAVASCTAGLHLALDAIHLREDDEVLVPTNTFTATAEVVCYFKAKPILVDVDKQTLCMDPADAARRIGPRTRAIIPVHFAGQPCDMSSVHAIARMHG